MNPFNILNVSFESNDKIIRKSYLKLIKKYNPDMFPEQFKEISNAYETIKNEKKRMEYMLFNKNVPITRPIDAIIKPFKRNEERKPIKFEQLKELLKNG